MNFRMGIPSVSYSRSSPLAGGIGGTNPGGVSISGTIPLLR